MAILKYKNKLNNFILNSTYSKFYFIIIKVQILESNMIEF